MIIFIIVAFFLIIGTFIKHFSDKKRTEPIKDEHLIKTKLKKMFPNNLLIESPISNKEPFNIMLNSRENNGFSKVDVWINHKDTSKISIETLKDRFLEQMQRLEDTGVNVIKRFYEDDNKLYCIADYRRDLNYNNCNVTM